MSLFLIAEFLWIGTMVYWFVSAFNVKRTQKRELGLSRILYILIWILAFEIMFTHRISFSFLYHPFFLQQQEWKIFGLICCAVGLSFTVWARITLGRNWSASVTIKENHELIQSGPYRFTRHPIYTGMLLAFSGLAFIQGEVHGYLAIPILITGIMIKLLQEEKFMRETFGEKYIEYSSRVKRLIPFIY